MIPKVWLVLGALLAGSSVLAGAYGAHGLEARLRTEFEHQPAVDRNHSLPPAKLMKNYEAAWRYQMIHSFALLLVGVMSIVAPCRWWILAGLSFLVGEALFCGSLYLTVFTWDDGWNARAPFGGVAFVAGWVLFAGAALLAKIQWPRTDAPA